MQKLLNEIAQITMGQSPKSSAYNQIKEGLPFLQGRTTFGRMYPSFDTWTTEWNKECDTNDILFTVRAPVGDVNIAQTKIALGRGVAGIRAKNVLPKYLYYLLYANKSTFIASSSGTIYDSINKDQLDNVKLKVHNDKDQQHIVDTIGSIDDLIEKNDKIIELTKKYIHQFYRSFDFDSTEKTLQDEFNISIGRTPPTKEHQWFDNGNYKWLSIKDMKIDGDFCFETSQYLTNEAVKKFNIPIVNPGDVLLSFKLTVGRIAISNCNMVTNEAIACFKFKDESLRWYLYCYLNNCNFLNDADNTSSIGQAINSSIIKKYKFLKPSNEKLIEFNNIVEPLFNYVKTKREENIYLLQSKQNLLKKYFG